MVSPFSTGKVPPGQKSFCTSTMIKALLLFLKFSVADYFHRVQKFLP